MKPLMPARICALLLLFPSLAWADQCVPVARFIELGEEAQKCVSEINLGERAVNEVLQEYNYCTDVRGTRDDVERKLNQLPAATMNRCAEQNLQAYTDAATSIQRLYQIEMSLK